MEESASFPAGDVADDYLMSDLERLMLGVDRTIGPYIVYKHQERKLKQQQRKLKFRQHGKVLKASKPKSKQHCKALNAIASLGVLQNVERRLWDELTHLEETSLPQGYTKSDTFLMLLEDHADLPHWLDPSEIHDHWKKVMYAYIDLLAWQDDHDDAAKVLIDDVVQYCSHLELSITALHMARLLTGRFPRHGPLIQLSWRDRLGPYAQRRKQCWVEHVCFERAPGNERTRQ